MPTSSWITFTMEARSVRRAGRRSEDIVGCRVVAVVVDPKTMFSAPALTGAATMTLRTPRAKVRVELLARVRKRPVHSRTISTPCSSHGTSRVGDAAVGQRLLVDRERLPSAGYVVAKQP
jgi:hypothetical protein